MTIREVWTRARREPFMVAAAVLVGASALLSASASWAAFGAQRAGDRDRIVDEAERCVTAWTTREDIRDATERATRGGPSVVRDALIALFPDADPADVEQLRALIGNLADAEVEAARAEIRDPSCNLAAARAELEEAGR